MFQLLPIEIVLKIFGYLDSYDLVGFCATFENYSYLLQEKDIVRTLDFSRQFQSQNIPLCKYITTWVNVNFVKILKINGLYWIPSRDLRRLLKNLVNLEVLHAIDTKLGITNTDIMTYTKLKKLAVTVDNQFNHSTITASKHLNVLKSLCLKFVEILEENNGIYLFFRELKQLEEVWICDETESTYQINYEQIAVSLKDLRKFVIKSKADLRYYNFKSSGLLKIFERKRNTSSTELVFVLEKVLKEPISPKHSIFEPAEYGYYRNSWQIFRKLTGTPFGPNESREIGLNSIDFEDLNFCHSIDLCQSNYVEAATKILSFKNSSKLKRLSFSSCLFRNIHYASSTKKEESVGFKRPRIGIKTSSETHPFETTVRNLKNLRELEILMCPSCAGGDVLSAYPLIAQFEYLEKLTLQIHNLLDGSFLKEVFTKCVHLESLSLLTNPYNYKFIMNLCQNLKYTHNLKHFRLEHKELSLSQLLNSFNEMEHKKLLRICVKSDTLRAEDYQKSVSAFLESNPQLIFCLLDILKTTGTVRHDIQKTMYKYKCGNPAKIYYVTEKASSFTGVFPIPPAHHDIIVHHANIGVIHLDEF